MMDRDLLVNAIAQSSDSHMRFIDAREDLLMNRSDNWRHELINGDSELVKFSCVYTDALDK